MTEHAPFNTTAPDHEPFGKPSSTVNPHAPFEPPQLSAPKLIFGVQSNSANGHSATWTAARVRGDRGGNIEYNYNDAELIAHLAGVKASYEQGCLPITLIEVGQMYLANIVPLTYAAKFLEAVVAVRAANPGKPYYVFEIINEPFNCGSNGSNASDYAAICKATYEALETAKVPLWPAAGGVMLLVAAHMTYQKKISEKVGGAFSDWTTGGGWLKDFIEAWPAAKEKVNGWTSHPYGEPNVEASHEGNNEIASAFLQHEQAVLLGYGPTGTNNWWITEFGFGVPPVSGHGAVATEALQASKLKESLEQMLPWHAAGWLTAVNVFADGITEWGIWGKTAQGVLTAFASAHG